MIQILQRELKELQLVQDEFVATAAIQLPSKSKSLERVALTIPDYSSIIDANLTHVLMEDIILQ
jgi:hypothetical protein